MFDYIKNHKKRSVIIALCVLIGFIGLRIFSAQFLYSEIGYKPVESEEPFRMALAVSPFTADAFNEGYTLSDEVAKAGGDLFMPGGKKDYENVLNALKEGKLDRNQLRINASRVVRMVEKLV